MAVHLLLMQWSISVGYVWKSCMAVPRKFNKEWALLWFGTKKLAGGNAEILSSWKMETVMGEKREINYRREKEKKHGWEYRSSEKEEKEMK